MLPGVGTVAREIDLQYGDIKWGKIKKITILAFVLTGGINM